MSFSPYIKLFSFFLIILQESVPCVFAKETLSENIIIKFKKNPTSITPDFFRKHYKEIRLELAKKAQKGDKNSALLFLQLPPNIKHIPTLSTLHINFSNLSSDYDSQATQDLFNFLTNLIQHPQNLVPKICWKELETILTKRPNINASISFLDTKQSSQHNFVTPLLLAIQLKNKPLILYLIDHGANLNLSNSDFFYHIIETLPKKNLTNSPNHTLTISYQTDFLRFLFEQGLNPDRWDNQGRTLLSGALLQQAPPEIIQMMIDFGAQVNRYDCLELAEKPPKYYKNHCTPIFHAYSPEIIDLLMHNGNDISFRNAEGKTVLEDITLFISQLKNPPTIILQMQKKLKEYSSK